MYDVPINFDILDLQERASRLLKLVISSLNTPAVFKPEDYLGRMIRALLNPQIEHMQSNIVLTNADLDRDAGLIAPSMLELFIKLQWTAKDPNTRALDGWAFGYIIDWRAIQ
jgi:hypothetical protein